MGTYVVQVELGGAFPADDRADAIMDGLADFGVALGSDPGTGAIVAVHVEAEGLRAAVITGLSLVAPYGEAVGVSALPFDLWERREEWPPVPPLVGVTEAAEVLGVSRQRVLQMIDERKLPASRAGAAWAISREAVDSVAGRRG